MLLYPVYHLTSLCYYTIAALFYSIKIVQNSGVFIFIYFTSSHVVLMSWQVAKSYCVKVLYCLLSISVGLLISDLIKKFH